MLKMKYKNSNTHRLIGAYARNLFIISFFAVQMNYLFMKLTAKLID